MVSKLEINNKGFTLIELIVVIVIVGIVSAALIINFATASRGIDEDSTLAAIQGTLDTGRYKTMASSKDTIQVELNKKDNGYFMTISNSSETLEEYKLCDKKHTIYICVGEETYAITDYIKFEFNKSDGAFKSITYNSDTNKVQPSTSNNIYITTDKGNRKLILALNTGRTVVE